MAHLLAMQRKLFTDGELFVFATTEEHCSQKINLFKSISHSARTVGRKTENTGYNINRQLQSKPSDFLEKWYFPWLLICH